MLGVCNDCDSDRGLVADTGDTLGGRRKVSVLCTSFVHRLVNRASLMVDDDPQQARRDMQMPVVAELSAFGFEDAEEIGHGGFGAVYTAASVRCIGVGRWRWTEQSGQPWLITMGCPDPLSV
ncbi:hypothetical protein GCM10027262_61840 [Nocardia tengchongensis]